MIVEVLPRRLDATPGVPQQVTVSVGNTGELIGGYTVRVLGADPGWVDATDTEVSLFPGESTTVTLSLTIPHGIPAGERRMAVQVRELTPPEESRIEEIVLVVPDDPAMTARTDPMTLTAGRTGRLSLLVDNTGNTRVAGRLAGTDEEGKVRFRFEPAALSLAPGEHAVVDLRVTARQHLLGSPVVRILDVHLDPSDRPGEVAIDPGPTHRRRRLLGRGREPLTAQPERDTPPLARATLVQKPLVARGAVSLLGLLAAITVFALVITLAFSRLAGQSAADRNLALEIATARNAAAGSGTAGLGGVVRLLTSGTPVPGVSVAVFAADDTATPLATTATGTDGAYAVGELPDGDYKVTFRGAGFVQLWWPQALDADSAETISLDAADTRVGLDVSVGGVPATLSGTIKGEDVSAATLTLRTPAAPVGTTATASSATGASAGSRDGAGVATRSAAGGLTARPPTATTVADEPTPSADPASPAPGGSAPATGAVVKTVPIGADGTFTLEGIPSPSVYEIEVSKPGYAKSQQRIDVSAGENREGLTITLRKGDGVIAGTIHTSAGPLGNVTLTATSGQTSVTTVSLDRTGAFTLRGLPTPGRFTVVASAPDYASQTLSLTLGPGQELTGVSITLGRSSGGLKGEVALSPGGDPAPGVGVTVTDGSQTVQTATRSSGSGVGRWEVSGLAVPGTYTVTFSRSDLASHTVSVSLDATGAITPSSLGGGVTRSGIDVSLHSATAEVFGTVRQKTGTGNAPADPAGEATVSLTSGTSTYTVTSASVPAGSRGKYRIQGIPPGTYTVSVGLGGVSPTSTILTLKAGDRREFSPRLEPAASILGRVLGASGPVGPGWVVELYRASSYPSQVYRRTTTRAGGVFDFASLDAPETYVVQVRPTAGSAPAGSSTLQLDASEHLTGLEVTTGG